MRNHLIEKEGQIKKVESNREGGLNVEVEVLLWGSS